MCFIILLVTKIQNALHRVKESCMGIITSRMSLLEYYYYYSFAHRSTFILKLLWEAYKNIKTHYLMKETNMVEQSRGKKVGSEDETSSSSVNGAGIVSV